jgi:hypothetical protein
MISIVEREPRAHAILHENCHCLVRGSSKHFLTVSGIHTTTREVFSPTYNTTPTLCQRALSTGIPWTDTSCIAPEGELNVHSSRLWTRWESRPLQRQALRLESRGIFSLAPVYYLRCWLITDVVTFCSLYYCGCLKLCF